MKKSYLIIAAIGLMLQSCGRPENDDVVKQPNKDGAIETVMTVTHEKGFDLLTTTHKVWVKNALAKTIVTKDTLVNLGETKQEAEDADGNTKTVTIPKDYEFYITVR